MVDITVQIKLGYENTEDTRTYEFGGLSESVLDDVKAQVLAINQSLAGGTAGGLSTFFVSDNGDNLKSIVSARAKIIEEEVLDLGSEYYG